MVFHSAQKVEGVLEIFVVVVEVVLVGMTTLAMKSASLIIVVVAVVVDKMKVQMGIIVDLVIMEVILEVVDFVNHNNQSSTFGLRNERNFRGRSSGPSGGRGQYFAKPQNQDGYTLPAAAINQGSSRFY